MTSTPGSRRSTRRAVSKELAFPNSVLALFGWPDREVRELCFRIYNEHIAEVQERSNNRIYGVGLINWWDAGGARRTLKELKELGLKTFLMPLAPGKDLEKRPIDYASTAMDRRVGGDRGGASPGLAPHRREPAVDAERVQRRQHRDAPVGGALPRHLRQVHLRRHPRPPPRTPGRVVRGRDQLGAVGPSGRRAHCGVVPAPRQPEGAARSDVLLGQPHVRVLHGRPARAWRSWPASASSG